jgi:hypothetical protein
MITTKRKIVFVLKKTTHTHTYQGKENKNFDIYIYIHKKETHVCVLKYNRHVQKRRLNSKNINIEIGFSNLTSFCSLFQCQV